MGKNVIVSEETLRNLLEAHASLSAWYHELWGAVHAAGGRARSPDDAARRAHVERLAVDFPEIAHIAATIGVPRMFVPAPASSGDGGASADEPATLVEPAPSRLRKA